METKRYSDTHVPFYQNDRHKPDDWFFFSRWASPLYLYITRQLALTIIAAVYHVLAEDDTITCFDE
jgi:hypothetical protein